MSGWLYLLLGICYALGSFREFTKKHPDKRQELNDSTIILGFILLSIFWLPALVYNLGREFEKHD